MLEILRRLKDQIRGYFLKKQVPMSPSVNIIPKEAFSSFANKEKALRIYKVQEENNKRLHEMNEKIANTLRRIQEVKKRMARSKINEIERKINQRPSEILKKHGLHNLSLRKFSEFKDLHEYIKFNRMGSITDKEIQTCDWQKVFRQLCE